MPTLLLAAAMSVVTLHNSQSPPVFRSEAYVIANYVVMLGKGDKPISGLTTADFSVVVDKKFPVPLSVSESLERAGAYILSFNPPDALRDGKAHRVDVKFKAPDGKWKTLPLNWKPTFEKPR